MVMILVANGCCVKLWWLVRVFLTIIRIVFFTDFFFNPANATWDYFESNCESCTYNEYWQWDDKDEYPQNCLGKKKAMVDLDYG